MDTSVHFVLVLSFVNIFLGVWAQPAEDEVKSLPGYSGPLSSRQYSGYLKASGTIQLHYWFVESQGNPSEDPVLLWLNGGPSCSSIDGYLTELGPYWVNSDGKTLSVNDYSWTKVASVIFLESPAGVGYSYAGDGDYSTNDDKTAENNFLALKEFFKKFPNMAPNEFFITGESYAGIYIPTLAVKLMDSQTDINFKGFAIGNGVLDKTLNTETSVEYAYYHAIIGESLWEKYQLNCCSQGSCHIVSKSSTCDEIKQQIHQLVEHSGINPYDVTGDCYGSFSKSSASSFSMWNFVGFDALVTSKSESGFNSPFLPCVDNTAIEAYMNLPEVRTALHIPDVISQKWTVCNPPLAANYTKQYSSMMKQFQALLPKYRALLYNGDADIMCNFLGDQKFVASLNRPILDDRRTWIYNNQVAGFVKEYEQVTFMTVKNSGHMVPMYTPGPALQMITNF